MHKKVEYCYLHITKIFIIFASKFYQQSTDTFYQVCFGMKNEK